MTSCRICGNAIRDDEDVLTLIAGAEESVVHDQCATAHETEPQHKTRLWAAMGSLGQLGLGAVQRADE